MLEKIIIFMVVVFSLFVFSVIAQICWNIFMDFLIKKGVIEKKYVAEYRVLNKTMITKKWTIAGFKTKKNKY